MTNSIDYGKVGAFFYTLRDEAGEELEKNREDGPMVYLHGKRNILLALEDALAGKQAGDSLSVTLPPEKAYGQRDDTALTRISKKRLNLRPAKLRPGAMVRIETAQGMHDATIVKVGKFNVDIDANHPLAGKTVTFEIDIEAVRDATQDELAHGHAHGMDGATHHHD
tara:strand:+ start:482 stop:982 length:501 start_codon:yes stop_codon:yes gene_type:complete